MTPRDPVLIAIQLLQEQMNSRFDSVDTRMASLDERFDRLNGRVRKTERGLAVIKALTTTAGVVLTFFGWDVIKTWLTSLTR